MTDNISSEDHQSSKQPSSDDSADKCREIMRREGWEITINSSNSYDNSLILLSTASLGFVFGITKMSDFQPICLPIIKFTLFLLLLSLFCSLLSFLFAQLHGNALMIYADLCYIDGKDEYRTKKPCSYYASATCKFTSGITFFLALVIFSIVFISNYESSIKKQTNPATLQINNSISPTQHQISSNPQDNKKGSL